MLSSPCHDHQTPARCPSYGEPVVELPACGTSELFCAKLPEVNGPFGSPRHSGSGFNEWYVFDSPFDLGLLCHGNIFESSLSPGRVWTFVNYDAGFALHNPEMADLTRLFWQQLDWIRPESFIADSSAFLTFVSRNDDLFVAVCNTIQGSDCCRS
jgi:hypothetical protein